MECRATATEPEGDPTMNSISILHQAAIFGPLTRPAITWRRLRRWLAARREKLDQRLLADRLQELRRQDPQLYADLPVTAGDVPPPRSALPLLPNVAIAGFLMEERH
jgi:hypothetical protein